MAPTKAVEDLNAKGGVLGQKLKLEVGDDACDPKQAVAVANDLASKQVVFVAGHFCSGSSIPASAVYSEEGILQITPASTNPKFTDDAAAKGWKTVFRTCGRDDQQGEFAGKWLAEHFKGKRVAVVHDKSAYGKGLADVTKKNMNDAGLQEVLYEGITAGEQGLHGAGQQAEGGAGRRDLFRRLSPRGGADRPPGREQGLNAPLLPATR